MFIFLKLIHVIFSIFWVGSVLTSYLIGFRLIKSGDSRNLQIFADQEMFVGKRIIGPSVLLTFLSGVIMAHYWFGWLLWTTWGFIVVLITGFMGRRIVPKQSQKLINLIIERGQNDELVKKAKKRFFTLLITLFFLLLSAVWAMVYKPNF